MSGAGENVHSVERSQRTHAVQSDRFRGLMSEHFGFAAWAREATSTGDIVAAQDALLRLGNYAYDDVVPGAWLPRVRMLQENAREVARANSIESLAMGVAQLGRACGECHAATGGGPAVSPLHEAPVTGPDTFPNRMFRHRRAIEALWLGLVAPSNAVWTDAAQILSSASSELKLDKPLPAEFEHALGRLQQLGARAQLAATPAERAQSYGQLLGACASCHGREWSTAF